MSKLHLIDLDDTLCATTRDLQGDRSKLELLELYPDAWWYINSSKVPRILVSAGDFDYQYAKIQHLGIEHFFHEICICESPEVKEVVFTSILHRFGVHPEDVMVIGDRVDCEIQFGNYIGATTVRIRRPDCKYSPNEPSDILEIPDHEVCSFEHLAVLI